jgi:hypothetical protein
LDERLIQQFGRRHATLQEVQVRVVRKRFWKWRTFSRGRYLKKVRDKLARLRKILKHCQ